MPREKVSAQLHWLLSFPILTSLILLGLVPIVFPIFSQYEGDIFPVVKRVEVSKRIDTPRGIVVDVKFDKVRSCEFLGISWYDSFGDRLPILFEVNGETDLPGSRPVRAEQDAGPWELIGIDRMDGSEAIVSHRCHPFWITYTHFYP